MDALDAAAGAAPPPQEEAFDRLSHELQHLPRQAATKVLRRLEPLRLSKGAKGRESAKVSYVRTTRCGLCPRAMAPLMHACFL